MHSISPPLLRQIYAKTPKGEDELVRPKFGLNPRQRRLLGFVDGSRPLFPLHAQFPVQEMEDIGNALTWQEFILLIGEKPEETVLLWQQGYASRHAFRWDHRADLHQAGSRGEQGQALTHDVEKVRKAKEFMLETAAVHLGILGREVVGKIGGAQSAHALASVAGQWTMALCASKSAGRYAQLYLEQLKFILFEEKAESADHHFF